MEAWWWMRMEEDDDDDDEDVLVLDTVVVFEVVVLLFTSIGPPEEREDEAGVLTRIFSRFHFARPAVEFSFLFHSILTPPVLAESRAISPFVILLSSSARKLAANSCFSFSNFFFASIAARSLPLLAPLDRLFAGLFLGDRAEGDSYPSSSESLSLNSCSAFDLTGDKSKGSNRPAGAGVFFGEWTSFHWSTTP